MTDGLRPHFAGRADLGRRLPRLMVLCALLLTALTSCYPEATIRYRLSIDVATPEGLKSGSGVVQVTYAVAMRFLGSNSEWGAGVRGEAVAVDLGARGTLFALLTQGSDFRSEPMYIVLRAFGFQHGSMPSPASEGIKQIATLRGRATIQPGNLPLLVRFRDPLDPTTVERVDPNDLAASFGEGLRLESAHIEITDDPVTTGIEKRLPWLPGRKDQPGYLHGPESDLTPLGLNLNGSEFSTELFR